MPTRSPFWVAGLNNATLEMWIGRSLSTMPPVTPFIGFGRACFFTRLTPSTTRCSSSTRRSTAPRLPLSRPEMMITSSPFLIRFMVGPLQRSQDFRGERHDLHETLGAQFPGHRAEDTGADRLEFG